MSRAAAALAATTLLTLCACSTVEVRETSFFYPRALMTDGERVEIVTADGTTLVGRLLRAAQPRATLIFFNGNNDLLALSGSRLHKYASFGFNVVAFDYRGYGESGGSLDVRNFESDSLSIFRAITARHDLGTPKVMLHGLSLGSFAATYVATQAPADALVLESAETNVREILHAWTPWYARPFVRFQIDPVLAQADNLSAVRAYRGPLLILSGKHDDVAPPAFAQALFAASASSPKQLISVTSGHNDVPDAPEFDAAFEAFASQVFGPPPAAPSESRSARAQVAQQARCCLL